MTDTMTCASSSTCRFLLRKLHPLAGGAAMAMIAIFLISTALSEILGTASDVAMVKRAILYGIGVLIPLLMMTGLSGFKLSGGSSDREPVLRKANRMKGIAANGLIVLLPCAVALDHLAQTGEFGKTFMMIQVIEMIAGLVNLTLMGLNMRDGITMRERQSES